MKISARNKFEATISAVNVGPISTEVVLDVTAGDKLLAVVTTESAKRLGLTPGKRAAAFVKASSVSLVTGAGSYRFSARNQFAGHVAKLTKGAVNSEVSLHLSSGNTISAVVTNEAVTELQLALGKPATALIKASQVILGVA